MVFAKQSPAAAHGKNIELAPAPIRADWILTGSPVARSFELASSIDGDSFTVMWDCTAGVFNWNFDCDETVHVVEGTVIVSWQDRSVTLEVGDTAYFPAGSKTLWKVDAYVRKIAFLRLPPPRVVSFPMRALRKVRRMIGSGVTTPVLGAAQARS